MTNKTFAIGDIHGRFDLLQKVLEYIEDKKEKDDIVVFLGDYVDRGPDSKKVLETLFSLQDSKTILLKGNHEDMMGNRNKEGLWLYNGGKATVDSYEEEWETLPIHRDKVRGLQTVYEDEYRYFVHASYSNYDEDRMWYRYPIDFDPREDKYIVHGHTPQRISPFVGQGRCNLDMGSFSSGQVAVATFDNSIPGPPIKVHVVNVG